MSSVVDSDPSPMADISFPHGGYLIFYRPLPDGVEIVRIIHGARNLSRLF
jgi:plasmid stabilization system protein ParE